MSALRRRSPFGGAAALHGFRLCVSVHRMAGQSPASATSKIGRDSQKLADLASDSLRLRCEETRLQISSAEQWSATCRSSGSGRLSNILSLPVAKLWKVTLSEKLSVMTHRPPWLLFWF